MKDNNYITIQGWMINKLKLSGNELIVYAAIYGFSQDGASKFEGSYQWLADAAGISKRAIITILGNLTERGLLQKIKSSKNGSKYFDYIAVIDCLTKETGEESSPMIGEESSPHITSINNLTDYIDKFTIPTTASPTDRVKLEMAKRTGGEI